MIFSTTITIYTFILLGLAIVSATIYCFWQWRRTNALKRFKQQAEQERTYLTDEQLPGISVLVYARNDAENLTVFLPMLLHQDYPDFEVIVTDDSSSDSTKDLLSDMISHYPNLRATFVPEGTRSLSRKKLSIMLGIKAASNDIIFTTSANCRVTSENWLRTMARNFTGDTDIVIGYSHYRYSRDKRFGRRYRVFDTVTTGAQYLISAINGKPYRGTSDNLAYRKSIFFNNTGFSRSLDLKWGDDDVFISEVANGGNTRIEIADESVVNTYFDNFRYAHHELKSRRDFTSRFVSTRKPFIVQALMSGLLYLAHLAAIAAIVINPMNLAVILTAAVTLIALWIVMALAVKQQCRLLQAPALSWSVPIQALWRPWVNMITHIRNMAHRKAHYTSIID